MLWHEHLRRAVKLTVVSGLHYSGLLSLIRRACVKNRAVILMYHRVTPRGEGVPDYSPNGMTVTPAEFAMQMKYLQRCYEIVPLSRIVAAVQGGQPSLSGLCAVTFDDGWRDIYDYAFPILRALSVPATVFLTTGFVNGLEWSWEERARFLLAQVHNQRERIVSLPEFRDTRKQLDASCFQDLLEVGSARLPRYLLNKIPELKKFSADDRRRVMRMLEEIADRVESDDRRPFLDWNQVRDMAQFGVEFGNHTVTHRVLPQLSDDEVVEEVCGATTEIGRQLGRSPSDFAYPYGYFGPRVESLVRKQGLTSACSAKFGLVEAGMNVFALNRINISSDVAGYEPLFAWRLLCL